MWSVIIISAFIISILSLFYLAGRLRKFSFFQKLDKKRAYLWSFAIVIVIMVVLFFSLGMMDYFICACYTIIFWALCDLAARIIRKVRGRETASKAEGSETSRDAKPRRYIAGIAALLLTVTYLAYARYNASHVVATHYDIPSEKISRDFRVIQITDAHMGTLFDAVQFGEYIDEMNTLHPDIVVVTGDFVDDTTDRENMLAACEALGRLQTKYGVYFVYGNHDRGYFSESSKGWTNEELDRTLRENNVQVMLDETVNLTDEICLVGRIDNFEAARNQGRKSITELIDSGDRGDRFTIVLDHQPREYAEEEAAGADLVLSGHTHGGQLFPINQLVLIGGLNDMAYGLKKQGSTWFEVSSGIGDWSVHFRTGCPSEYVVLDIKPD